MSDGRYPICPGHEHTEDRPPTLYKPMQCPSCNAPVAVGMPKKPPRSCYVEVKCPNCNAMFNASI